LEGHRRLAGALRPADEHQLARLEPPTDRPVEGRQPNRDRLVLRELAREDLVVDVDEDVERRARGERATLGVEAPRRRLGLVARPAGAGRWMGRAAVAGALGTFGPVC